MNTILLCIALCLVYGLLFSRRTAAGWMDLFGKTVFLSVVGGFAGAVLALILGAFVPFHWVEDSRFELASMRTTEGTAGAFVCGSGSFGQETYYRVLLVRKGNSFSPFSVRATSGNTRIVEDAGLVAKGYLTISTHQPDRQSLLYNWSINPHAGCASCRRMSQFYEFTVPKGSVKYQFSVE